VQPRGENGVDEGEKKVKIFLLFFRRSRGMECGGVGSVGSWGKTSLTVFRKNLGETIRFPGVTSIQKERGQSTQGGGVRSI